MDNVIDLAEYRERKKLDEPQGLTWLRAYVARNGRSQPGRPPRLLRPPKALKPGLVTSCHKSVH